MIRGGNMITATQLMQVTGMTDGEFDDLLEKSNQKFGVASKQFLGVTEDCHCLFRVLIRDPVHLDLTHDEYFLVFFDDGVMRISGPMDPDVVFLQQS